MRQSNRPIGGHQSARPCRGHRLSQVGGTDWYYKEEWVPREVHDDFLGVLLTVSKCEMSVRSGGRVM